MTSDPEAHVRLVLVTDRLLATHLLPGSGSVVVGRTGDADVSVAHVSVSRRHAIVRWTSEVVEIEDLGSSNGTWLNGGRLAPGRRMVAAPHDLVRLGQVLCILQREWDAEGEASGHATFHVISPHGEKRAGRPAGDFLADASPVIVRTEAMQRLFSQIERVSKSNISVLVLGETGAGKEIVAHSIHARSRRAEKPFLGINCAALPESLLESELFGHERGAFTGAHAAKMGLLEQARGGTVFLDEIGDMSLAIQAKLLRVFEERQVFALGAVNARPIDVRFVAATNKDLEREVEAGRFRKDFYFRLCGVTLRIPPLRKRVPEIAPLARLFIENAVEAEPPPTLTPEALAALEGHDWPGNIRELRNVVERAVVFSEGGPILPEHLALNEPEDDDVEPGDEGTATTAAPAADLNHELASIERARIVEAMERCAWNQTKVAKLLGIPRRSLMRKLDAYAIQRPRKT
jgi:DNA-binding NtrC family response regulator